MNDDKPKKNSRWASQYRSQWSSVSRNPFSVSVFSYDRKMDPKWSVGAYAMSSDEAGYFNTFSLVLSGAYMVSNKENMDLSVGLQLGGIYYKTKNTDLIFDQQYTQETGTFNPNLNNGENFARSSGLMPELNAGVVYINKGSSAFKPYAGGAIFHVTAPKHSLYNDKKARLPRRFVVHGGLKYEINSQFTLDPRLLFMIQGVSKEINAGLRAWYKKEEVEITTGLYYRVKDAIIPMAGAKYKNSFFRISYDINVSSLSDYTNRKGGLEFSLIFYTK